MSEEEKERVGGELLFVVRKWQSWIEVKEGWSLVSWREVCLVRGREREIGTMG